MAQSEKENPYDCTLLESVSTSHTRSSWYRGCQPTEQYPPLVVYFLVNKRLPQLHRIQHQLDQFGPHLRCSGVVHCARRPRESWSLVCASSFMGRAACCMAQGAWLHALRMAHGGRRSTVVHYTVYTHKHIVQYTLSYTLSDTHYRH